MIKRKKIFIVIILSILTLCSFAINIFGVYTSSYINNDNFEMYLYRYNDIYTIGSYSRYYYSIYTNHEKDNNWVTDVTNLTYKEFQKLDKDVIVNSAQLYGSILHSTELFLNSIYNYLDIKIVDNDAMENVDFGYTNVFHRGNYYDEKNIASLFLLGYYYLPSSAINLSYTSFDDFVNSINDVNQSFNTRSNFQSLFFYKFAYNLSSAFAYAYNASNANNIYQTSCLSICLSPDLREWLCNSIFNIAYYEYGITDINYSDIQSLFNTVSNEFNNIPSGMNSIDYYTDFYIYKQNIILPSTAGIKTTYQLTIDLNYTESNINNSFDMFNIVTMGYNYLKDNSLLSWLPLTISVPLLSFISLQLMVIGFFFVKKIVSLGG